MNITTAKKDQLSEVCKLVHDAIRHLCMADHQNTPLHLANWLKARSEEALSDTLFAPDSRAFVCMDGDEISGVAHITEAGLLTLCYVRPEQVGKDVGSMLLAEVERQAVRWGLQEIKLISTETARRFYLNHAYEQYAEPILYIGMPGYPMVKKL